jgi:hypothetical protein
MPVAAARAAPVDGLLVGEAIDEISFDSNKPPVRASVPKYPSILDIPSRAANCQLKRGKGQSASRFYIIAAYPARLKKYFVDSLQGITFTPHRQVVAWVTWVSLWVSSKS